MDKDEINILIKSYFKMSFIIYISNFSFDTYI